MKDFSYLKYLFILVIISFTACRQEKTSASGKEEDDDGFISIFDSQSMEGWEGDPDIWRVEDGLLIGELTAETDLKSNTFLIWKGGEPRDFELKVDFKITENGNSGINYRSERLEDIPFALRGYQADIDGKNTYTGQNYEERKRTTLAYRGQQTKINPQDPPGEIRDFVERNAWRGLELTKELGDRDSLKNLIKAEDWNQMHLVIKGNHLQHFVNGILMSEVVDEDLVNRSFEGFLGFQVHVGPPMQVAFKNIYIKEK
ncbi:3-keto-disaccharide hydrolase [Cecembia rubra]|uniref:Uncharacterized protein DUF1080 n=1 Tax=Cecembia rubra TaxID=1485585 RepID=A0A2P8DWT4_9BACT|nr:DUF1080 domain-containing protein [Cecembia rubra]PSL01670.1 uncharacterized protein DUF1080 [Cecembia rubra]